MKRDGRTISGLIVPGQPDRRRFLRQICGGAAAAAGVLVPGVGAFAHSYPGGRRETSPECRQNWSGQDGSNPDATCSYPHHEGDSAPNYFSPFSFSVNYNPLDKSDPGLAGIYTGGILSSLDSKDISEISVANGDGSYNNIFTKDGNYFVIVTNIGANEILIQPNGGTGVDKRFTDAGLSQSTPPRKARIGTLQSAIVPVDSTLLTADANPGFCVINQLGAGQDISAWITQLIEQHTEGGNDETANQSPWSAHPFAKYFNNDTAGNCLPLLISSQDHTDYCIQLNPWKIVGQPTPANAENDGYLDYEVFFNLWYLPAGSEANIHREHYSNVLEVHTQLFGMGRKQMFTQAGAMTPPADRATQRLPDSGFMTAAERTADQSRRIFLNRFQEERLAPGDSDVLFATVIESDAYGDDSVCKNASVTDPRFYTPWHQYYSDTNCIRMAFELHRRTDPCR